VLDQSHGLWEQVAFTYFRTISSAEDSPRRTFHLTSYAATTTNFEIVIWIMMSCTSWTSISRGVVFQNTQGKGKYSTVPTTSTILQTKPRPQGKAEVPLVVYVLLETEDGANDANLHYFVREGIREDDGCTHIILVDPKRVGIMHSSSFSSFLFLIAGKEGSGEPSI